MDDYEFRVSLDYLVDTVLKKKRFRRSAPLLCGKQWTKWYVGIDRVCGTNICSTDSKKYTRDNLGRGLCITGHLCGVHVHRPGRLSDG